MNSCPHENILNSLIKGASTLNKGGTPRIGTSQFDDQEE